MTLLISIRPTVKRFYKTSGAYRRISDYFGGAIICRKQGALIGWSSNRGRLRPLIGGIGHFYRLNDDIFLSIWLNPVKFSKY